MGADDAAHIADDHILDTVLFLQDLLQSLGILQAIAVGDGNGIQVDAGLTQLLGQVFHGSLTAADLVHGDQVTFVIHMDDGLDAQHAAEESSGGADAAAPLQMVQIVHGEPVREAHLVVFHPLGQIVQAHALGPLVAGMPHQKTLAQGGAEGVHHADGTVGIVLHHFLGSDDSRLVGGADTGVKSQAQNVFAGIQDGLHDADPAVGVDGGGGGHFAAAHAVIEILQISRIVQVVQQFALEQDGQRGIGNTQVLVLLIGKVAAGIGNDAVVHMDNTPVKF